jgi:hypothetical protein
MLRPNRSTRLCRQLVSGARDQDDVRLHGAIVAAFELYSPDDVALLVVEPALAELVGDADAFRRASAAASEQRAMYAAAAAAVEPHARSTAGSTASG